jgi:D-glycero-D-manno-heptose 1,7-bisphosphate phosphatase
VIDRAGRATAAHGRTLVCWTFLASACGFGSAEPGNPSSVSFRPLAVLFDRDGTLIDGAPCCADPVWVRPMPGVRLALGLLRVAGVRTGVITDQPGIARGLITAEQVGAVNDRVDELLGPFDVWRVCPHDPDEGCACRKPAPGMVLDAAAALGVNPNLVAVVGNSGADVEAARAAGAAAVLVPTPATRREDILAAPAVRGDLLRAVRHLLGTEPQGPGAFGTRREGRGAFPVPPWG